MDRLMSCNGGNFPLLLLAQRPSPKRMGLLMRRTKMAIEAHFFEIKTLYVLKDVQIQFEIEKSKNCRQSKEPKCWFYFLQCEKRKNSLPRKNFVKPMSM